MPWPMLHFTIAYELYQNEPSDAFLLGSLAPDVVHVYPRDNERYAYSHLMIEGKWPSVEVLCDFYAREVTDEMGEEQRAFYLGYLCHIYADLRWVERKKSIAVAAVGTPDPSIRKEMWQEENQLDFNLFRQQPWTEEARRKVQAATIYEVGDRCKGHDLETFRKQVFEFLDTPENEPGIELKYITENVAVQFAREVAEEFTKEFLQMQR